MNDQLPEPLGPAAATPAGAGPPPGKSKPGGGVLMEPRHALVISTRCEPGADLLLRVAASLKFHHVKVEALLGREHSFGLRRIWILARGPAIGLAPFVDEVRGLIYAVDVSIEPWDGTLSIPEEPVVRPEFTD